MPQQFDSQLEYNFSESLPLLISLADHRVLLLLLNELASWRNKFIEMNDDDDDDLKPKDQRKVRQVSFLSLLYLYIAYPFACRCCCSTSNDDGESYLRSLTMERICALVLGREAAVVGGGSFGERLQISGAAHAPWAVV